jgi:hypothetical protein
LATAFFVPGAAYSDSALMIDGIHKALLCLGALTLVSTVVFTGRKPFSSSKQLRVGGV